MTDHQNYLQILRDITTVGAETKELRRDLTATANQIAALTTSHNGLTQHVTRLETKLESTNEAITNLNTNIVRLADTLDAVRTENAERRGADAASGAVASDTASRGGIASKATVAAGGGGLTLGYLVENFINWLQK